MGGREETEISITLEASRPRLVANRALHLEPTASVRASDANAFRSRLLTKYTAKALKRIRCRAEPTPRRRACTPDATRSPHHTMTRIYSLISNPYLPEVTRVVLVHHNPVVVLATRVTATGRVLAVLANTTMTRGHVTALLAVLVSLLGRKFGERVKRYVSFWFAWSVTSSSSRHAPGDRVAGASMPNPRSSHANAKSRWRAGQRRKAVVATRHRPSRDTDSDVGGVRTCVGILKPFAVCRAACATTKRVTRWPDDADEKAVFANSHILQAINS